MSIISAKCFLIKTNYSIKLIVLLSIVLNIKCILSYQRRGVFRMIRKSPLLFFPPKAAPAQFNAAYELPPFLPSPPTPSNSYGAPVMQYGLPMISQTPPSNYGAPGPAPAPSYGPPSSTIKPVIYKHVYVHVPPPEPDVQVSK